MNFVSMAAIGKLYCGQNEFSPGFWLDADFSVVQATPYYQSSIVPANPTHPGFLYLDVKRATRNIGDQILSVARYAPNKFLMTGCLIITEEHRDIPGSAYVLEFDMYYPQNWICDDDAGWPRCETKTQVSTLEHTQSIYGRFAGSDSWYVLENDVPLILDPENSFHHMYTLPGEFNFTEYIPMTALTAAKNRSRDIPFHIVVLAVGALLFCAGLYLLFSRQIASFVRRRGLLRVQVGHTTGSRRR